jgi:hypothetical protein
VGAVERLGDHDPEHRVAEELQALVGRDLPVLVGERAVRQGTLQQLGIQDRITERCAELVGGQRTWRRSALAPYWPHWPHARCGRCLEPQAGLAQVTRVGATAFHCERRWRVLLRDIFRLGTAMVVSCCLLHRGLPARWSVVWVLLGLCLQLLESCPARVDRRVVRVVRVVRESRTALGAQSRAIVHAQRLER